MLKNPDVDIAPELIEGLRLVGTPTATAYLMGQGYNHAYAIGIPAQVLGEGQTMVGRARTLRFLPKREDLLKDQYNTVGDRPHRDAIESIQPGEILVIDACGSFEAGVVGDMFTRRVQELGGQGIVIDGCVRDMSAIGTIGLPLFCKGSHGSGINRALMSADYQQPIRIGNTPVLPGDVLMGDADGVVVVPPHQVEGLVAYGIEHEVQERFTRLKLEEGHALHEAYPPNAELRPLYLEWRKSQPEYAQYPFAFKGE
ncbi:MAG: ribonuclease activity regulator RraA [Candidatus Latescibacteria bacterium]|nr:ribonuclease activity regulator RraA [Candidatus Latescibacterota bacterium]